LEQDQPLVAKVFLLQNLENKAGGGAQDAKKVEKQGT
jgi:hypothetical protein